MPLLAVPARKFDEVPTGRIPWPLPVVEFSRPDSCRPQQGVDGDGGGRA